ncbi:tRNA lysidine(34) synthetase TilS [Fusibacillus kribbianus]|uniref:tRNA(Ile)-lysidine synthase n=1 Tax=Fusibacillus kribbianus TaxID=3044208 RepID=A0AAP4BA10_9FIRM|nr:tRNA lysidine(34) synthetase TilS [Ruminococcus sp. YH-rum2234]MDI9241982.1 tRNA lysidine(34) synthetase TilS [Ruminococcus sp. YH-rum2234]
MLQKVLDIIKQEELIQAGETVAVGVSGGADSICLLSVLWELKERLDIRVAAVHVHHGIRGAEADRDEAFVRRFCQERDVPLLVYHRQVPKLAAELGLSEEEAGRMARYECFRQAKKGLPADRIAVAHNQNDHAETVLFHLFRGSGLTGLSGMAAKAPLPFDGTEKCLIRPLLRVTRREIENYLAEKGLSCCQDSTNASEEYARNRIRNRILPEACRINEEAVQNIARAAEMIAAADRWVNRQAGEWIGKHVIFGENRAEFPCEELLGLEELLSGCVLRSILERLTGSLKDITKRHTDSILKLAGQQTGRKLTLPGGLEAVRVYEKLQISLREKTKAGGTEETELSQAGAELFLKPEEEWKTAELFGFCFRYRIFERQPGQKIPENRYTKWFAYDKIKGNLSLRARRTGDWFQAFSDGRRQTVKAYMVNEKIPSGERNRLPLLCEGSHVLWVVGGRTCEGCRVTQETRWILEVSARTGSETAERNGSVPKIQ